MERYICINSVLCFTFFLQLVSSQLPSDQITTMRTLYDLVLNQTADSAFPWQSSARDSDPCYWKGVSCGADNQSVSKISLHNFGLTSSDFLPVVCQIGTLESLDISNNRLSSIPTEFMAGCGEINGLKLLNISRNVLGSTLPVFKGFAGLEHLDLSRNNLSGTVASQLDVLVALKSLNLSYNRFTESVPINCGKSIFLEEIVLSTNSFQGPFPQEIVDCKNLTTIDFSFNNLNGTIPERISELSRLQTLVLSSNRLSGGVPQSLSIIPTLQRFAANQNNFVGGVPAGITRYLSSLDLSFNGLTGSVPIDFLSSSKLQYVDLSFNKLDGSLPADLSPGLIRLRFKSNALNGTIPPSLGTLQKLIYLELDDNRLSGAIPTGLGSCQHLALLSLAQNNLTGPIPVELANLINLQVLYLQHNKLFGIIPPQLERLNRLQRLNISWNSLNGMIPTSISNLKNLTNVDLRGNNLTGSIPKGIESLNSLIELQLGRNRLSGTIPSMPPSLQISLNLSYNNLEGSIPTSLSRLVSLEVLDLSDNRLSGGIPTFLVRMVGLTRLDLSNNQLSGIVPQIRSFVEFYYDGNKGLINATSVPPQPAAKRKQTITVVVVVAIAVAVAVLTISVAVFVAPSLSKRSYRINDERMESGGEVISLPQIIRGNLLTASVVHRANIDFGKGTEAVTNPSNMVLKTKFSTYYKAIMPSGMTYFVKKLNWSDKVFQMGNYQRFGEELYALGKLSNSNVMIPLAYVLLADSAYLFYEFSQRGALSDILHGRVGNRLDWASRYSIAIGIAQGLAFLHAWPSGPILLLDLSSKSIMLKSHEEPQIGDLELSKVIDPSKNTGSLSTIAGSVGYIPPEYAYTMRVTMAGNVYSFGVILLELLTGKQAVSQGTELAKWVLTKAQQQQSKWDHILDFTVSRAGLKVRSQMLAVLEVALACVSVSPEARPKAKSVLRMLLSAR